MFCTKCGKEILEGQAFCTGCGTKVERVYDNVPVKQPAAIKEDIVTQAEPVEQTTGEVVTEAEPVKSVHVARPVPPPSAPVKKKGSPLKALMIFLIVIIVVVVVGVAGLYFFIEVLDSGFSYGFNKEDYMPDGYVSIDDESEEQEQSDVDAPAAEAAEADNSDVYGALYNYASDNSFSVDGLYNVYMSYDRGAVTFDYSELMPSGCLASKISDFDEDGTEELLMIQFTDNRDFVLEMYEYADGDVKLVSTQKIDNLPGQAICYGEGLVRFMIVDANKILIENRNSVWVQADGVWLSYDVITYTQEAGFSSLASNTYSGSDGLSDSYTVPLTDMGLTGVSWDDLFMGDKWPSDYFGGAELLSNISVVHVIDSTAYSNWYENVRDGDKRVLSDLQVSTDRLEPAYMYQSMAGASGSGEILPDSSTRLIEWSELEGLSKEECRIARNEIYARHGRMFDDEELRNHFRQFDWYEEIIQAKDFKESMLSDIEMQNRDRIIEYEEEKGYR